MTTADAVLAALSRAGELVPASALAAAIGMPRPAVRTVLADLAARGQARRQIIWGDAGLREMWAAVKATDAPVVREPAE